MTTAVAPDRESHHSEDQQPTTPGRDGADKAGEELDTRSFDPTQGRTIGSDPYDDPTQGRKIGSNRYDDPTRARTKTQPRLIKPVPVSTTNNLRPGGTRRSQQ